jgi:hypothetical protein
LPAGLPDACGAVFALLAMAVLAATGIDLELTQHGIGAGQPFSLGVGALLAAIFFAVRLRRGRPWRSA